MTRTGHRRGRRRPLPLGRPAPGDTAPTTTPSGGCRSTGEAAYLERLTLEAFQSGLSWRTILNKREAFREVFAGFDADVVAAYDDGDVARLMAEPGSSATGSRSTPPSPTPGRRSRCATGAGSRSSCSLPPRAARAADTAEMATTSPESVALSKALKKQGFAFVGPTTMYALMEAIGIVDDHLGGLPPARAGG